MNERGVSLTFGNTQIHDFEDGLQYYSALESNCDIIVTEDISDFYFSEIPVRNTDVFWEEYFKAK